MMYIHIDTVPGGLLRSSLDFTIDPILGLINVSGLLEVGVIICNLILLGVAGNIGLDGIRVDVPLLYS